MSELRRWGEVFLPEQKVSFARSTIAVLKSLVGRVQELGLAPLRLASDPVRVRVDGRRGWGYLWINEDGLAQELRWGLFPRRRRWKRLEVWELPDLLEAYRFGLEDVEKRMQAIDVILVLRELLSMPEIEQIRQPIVVVEDQQDSHVFELKLTAQGLEDEYRRHYKPEEIGINFVLNWDLKVHDVKKVVAKLKKR